MATNNSWNSSVSASKGAITLNAGTNQIDISSDAAATTVNLATGAAVKTVQLGTTNTTSATVIKSGTGNIAMNSGLTVDSTGRNYNTVQPSFLAFKSATTTNVSGTGTLVTIIADNEIYDIGGNYNAGTGVFTAPITGIYFFMNKSYFTGCTIASECAYYINTTAQNSYNISQRPAQSRDFMGAFTNFLKMTAGDTAVFKAYTFGESADTDDLFGGVPGNFGTVLSGYFFG